MQQSMMEFAQSYLFYVAFALVGTVALMGWVHFSSSVCNRLHAKNTTSKVSKTSSILGSLKKVGAGAVRFDGVLIVGAGPSGLAVAACLRECGVPSILLEQAGCIGSLWQNRTYDRLHLHLSKKYCELPWLSFPKSFPTYPSKNQFITYLSGYAAHFDINPRYGERVISAKYCVEHKVWHVKSTKMIDDQEGKITDYSVRWLVVASGENADPFIPELPGIQSYEGKLLHSSEYRTGREFLHKKALVVGSGNSGMEISLDLMNHGAKPSLVIRSPVHVFPRDILGISTYAIIMSMVNIFPLWFTDVILDLCAYLNFGNINKYGIKTPKGGALERKKSLGKSPVLDVGTMSLIKHGKIQVQPAIESLTSKGAKFVDGKCEDFDVIVMATGFKSNVHLWLENEDKLLSKNGFPQGGWNGGRGLYFLGFSRNGIYALSKEARRISDHISPMFVEKSRTLLS